MTTTSPRSVLPFVRAAGIVAAALLAGAVSTAHAAASLTPLGINSIGNGVSSNGSVAVGISYSSDGGQDFRWTAAGGMVPIPPLHRVVLDGRRRHADAVG